MGQECHRYLSCYLKQIKNRCIYGFSAILSPDSVVAGIPEVEVCSATYVFLRVGVGVVKEIRRAAVAARKASSWHKFGTGSYLLLRVQREIGQMLGH